MTDKATLIDVGTEKIERPLIWPSIVIPTEDIDAEVERLTHRAGRYTTMPPVLMAFSRRPSRAIR